MKILHIIPSLAKGGAERLVLDICTELSSRKELEVVLVTFRPENDYAFMSDKITHVVIPAQVNLSVSGKNSYHLDELNHFIDTFQPDVIHSHLFEAEVVSRAVLKPHVRYFTHCHDNMHQFKKMSAKDLLVKTRLTEWYERNWLLKQYRACKNHFIYISQFIESYFQTSLPGDVFERHTLLHNCIDLKKFTCNHNQQKDTNLIRLLNCGSFTPKKNQAFLIEVMVHLLEYNKKITLDLIGDGPLLNDLQQKVDKLNLDGNIFFRGKVNDVQAYYCQSNIYVHSAKVESFGLVLLEAMAAGLPVVTLDGLGNRDLIEDGKMGYMLRELDPKVFANTIIRLLEDPEQYNFMSEQVRQFVKKFDVVEYVDRLVQLYQKADDPH